MTRVDLYKKVKLIPTRWGLTIVSTDRTSTDNLEKARENHMQ